MADTHVSDAITQLAQEHGWAVTTHKMGTKAEKAIKVLNPGRGKRDFAATLAKGNATFAVSTIRNPMGGQHPDGCYLTQGGKTTLVGYWYQIAALLATPQQDGNSTVPARRSNPARAAAMAALADLATTA